jgi:hypothetical protein
LYGWAGRGVCARPQPRHHHLVITARGGIWAWVVNKPDPDSMLPAGIRQIPAGAGASSEVAKAIAT